MTIAQNITYQGFAPGRYMALKDGSGKIAKINSSGGGLAGAVFETATIGQVPKEGDPVKVYTFDIDTEANSNRPFEKAAQFVPTKITGVQDLFVKAVSEIKDGAEKLYTVVHAGSKHWQPIKLAIPGVSG